MLFFFVMLFCLMLFCLMLFCLMLFCLMLFCPMLFCPMLFCPMLFCLLQCSVAWSDPVPGRSRSCRFLQLCMTPSRQRQRHCRLP